MPAWTPLVASCTALVAVLLTFLLALPRFRREAVWQTKKEAYERLLEAIHQMKVALDYDYDAHTKGVSEADEPLVRFEEARREVERSAELGRYLFGKTMADHLHSYLSILNDAEELDSYVEIVAYSLGATDATLMRLIEFARYDLKIDGPFRRLAYKLGTIRDFLQVPAMEGTNLSACAFAMMSRSRRTVNIDRMSGNVLPRDHRSQLGVLRLCQCVCKPSFGGRIQDRLRMPPLPLPVLTGFCLKGTQFPPQFLKTCDSHLECS